MSLATQHSQKSGSLSPSLLSNSTVSCGWMSAAASARTEVTSGTVPVGGRRVTAQHTGNEQQQEEKEEEGKA